MPNPLRLLGRRTFLVVAAAAAIGRPAFAWPGPAPEAAPGIDPGFAFRRPGSAIAIGRRYLKRYPDDTASRALASDLRRVGAGDPEAARRALRARVRQDFARGDTVMIEGWVLARSECRACAALALAAGAAP